MTTQAEILSRQLTPAYNCAHLASDVWESETGRDIRPILIGFLAPQSQRRVSSQVREGFERIPAPTSPSIVLFRRRGATPHVGVFLRGRVIHLTRTGVVRQPLNVAALGYTSVRFYAPRPHHN